MNPLPFQPPVATWFQARFEAPTPPQEAAWRHIRSGRHTLIAAPTGSGKTLAAFLASIDALVEEAGRGPLPDRTSVLYISPLKALSNDIERNLQAPLRGIDELLAAGGNAPSGIRVLVRTGDTPQSERTAMVKRPPHIVVTTPESFYLLLTSDGGRSLLKSVRTVIVDEIHALAGNKRGTHLALSLERLEALTGVPPLRIGLSATQEPIEEVARFLVGRPRVDASGAPDCAIVDLGHRRALDLAVEIPDSPLEAVMSADVWKEVYDRIGALIEEHRTTLVFVNTRHLAERVTQFLSERIGAERITSHHGSLSREHRLRAEQRLKRGELRALVATSSLELGIDVGDVDLVCQVGSTRSIAAFLQRVGRSGHWVGATPKGRLFPLTRDELAESAALLTAVRQGLLDRLHVPGAALDILAQQIVAEVGAGEWDETALFEVFRRAWPYRDLPRESYDAVLRMLAEGFTTRRGRRGAYLHRDLVNGRLRPRRGARLTAITSGGAIPDTADYQVVLDPSGAVVGSLNEDFAVESSAGDVFQLGNASWRILRVEAGKVRVADAQGQPPTIPFWFGEAPARTEELSRTLSDLRKELGRRLEANDGDTAPAIAWLQDTSGLSVDAARQLVDYLETGRRSLGVIPTQDRLVLERFFDESGGMQLVLHAPFGGRVNRGWGLALRKRFCRSFNFELQAAATEDAIILSLGATHSFPLEDVFRFLHEATVRDVLTQALLDAPMFEVRWRWNAGRALAVPRFRGGRKVAPQLQRIQAEDLLSVVFPDQLACLENIAGDREIPDHPLVEQTLRDCLEEAMDVDGLEALIGSIRRGERTLVARDVTEPSPFAAEILGAKPYAFLDDAPLEERRTQAVMSRRWLDPKTASDLGALDGEAIARVREEAAPEAENADELHDALVMIGALTAEEIASGPGWRGFLRELIDQGRVTLGRDPREGATPRWIPVERLPEWRATIEGLEEEPALELPAELRRRDWSAEEARVELVRGRLEVEGPISATALARLLGLAAAEVEQALGRLETEGFVLRGAFTPGVEGTEWCERRLLARIHRYTLNRLRREIEAVSAGDFLRFLFQWQGVAPEARGHGPEALLRAVEQLEGFEAPAASWEQGLLPGRLRDYDPAWLDHLCLTGRVVWARLSPPGRGGEGERRGSGPVRSTPMALVDRARREHWLALRPAGSEIRVSGGAAGVLEVLRARGASFADELARGAGLLPAQTEEALRELVYLGLVTADGFTGLRALLLPANRRDGGRPGRRRRPRLSIQEAGRWTLLSPAGIGEESPAPGAEQEAVDHIARVLLRRYGVVFHRVLQREGALPPWRDLLWALRRMEARGEVRGGRFVAGFTGEQYALPEAVGMLRDVRRRGPSEDWVSVSGADPLNLSGILTPDARVPALAGNRVLYRGGEVIAIRIAGEDRILKEIPGTHAWEVLQRLTRTEAHAPDSAPALSPF